MTKHLRAIKVSLIIGILLSGAFIAFSTPVTAQRPKLLSFASYINFEYDPSPLNENLAIDKSVSVPITVKYWTDVPENFLNPIWTAVWPLRNYFLFGSMVGPMQMIHLEIIDPPDWANIYISTPDILTNIPIGEEMLVDTNLVLSPRIEAPAVSYKITIRASCESIKRINGVTFEENIDFTPQFVPTIQITPENPTRTVGPRESVDFTITIKNLGNKITKVTPTIIGGEQRWVPTINPPVHEISPQAQEEFIFSIYTPFDFGWHNEIKSFQIDFASEVYPYREGTPSDTRSIYLRVNNYGFSTPGFEVITLIVAMACIAIIIKKRQVKKG